MLDKSLSTVLPDAEAETGPDCCPSIVSLRTVTSVGRTAVKSIDTDGPEMLGVGTAGTEMLASLMIVLMIPGTMATPVGDGTVALLSPGIERIGMPMTEVIESTRPPLLLASCEG